MKKVVVLIVSFMLFVSSNIQASLFQAPNPYSFGPQGRPMADLRDFAKPKQMADILTGRPVAATKSDGTRVYYSSGGKLCLSIKRNGEMSFSLGGHSMSFDKYGKLKSETKTLKGNIQEIRDEFGEISSYNKLDGNGKVIESYDKDMNKTNVFYYDKYGKHLEYSVNLMNGQKTVYDRFERAMAIYTAEGRIVTTYQYTDVSYDTDENCLELFVKKKNVGDKKIRLETSKNYSAVSDITSEEDSMVVGHFEAETTFYKEGRDGDIVDYIVAANNTVLYRYYYEKDTSGNTVLASVYDCIKGERTFYENGKQKYTINSEGGKIREYYYDGSKFSFSVELGRNDAQIKTSNSDNMISYSNVVYNKDGQISAVLGEKGNIIERYFYREDAEGNKILDYVENVEDGTKTYYEYNYDVGKACATKTVDPKGDVLIDYGYNGSQKIYEFNRETGITTWYSGDGNEIIAEYLSLGSQLISKNIYSGGQLIGRWNAKDKTLTICVNEQDAVTFENLFDEEPDVNEVRRIVYDYMRNTVLNNSVENN